MTKRYYHINLKETSIEIAKSCNLIKKDMDLIDLTSDFNSVKIDQNFDKVIAERLREYSSVKMI